MLLISNSREEPFVGHERYVRRARKNRIFNAQHPHLVFATRMAFLLMEECNLLSVGLPFLKFRRFIPKVSPKFSCASAGAQLRTNGNSPKFRWNFRRGSFCHRSPFSVGQSLVVALICVESNIWAPTRGCPNVSCGIYLGRHTGLPLRCTEA